MHDEVQSNEKRFDDTDHADKFLQSKFNSKTVRMLQIQVPAMRQSGEHSSNAIDSVDRFCGDAETDAQQQEDPEVRSLTLCTDSARHPGDSEDR